MACDQEIKPSAVWFGVFIFFCTPHHWAQTHTYVQTHSFCVIHPNYKYLISMCHKSCKVPGLWQLMVDMIHFMKLRLEERAIPTSTRRTEDINIMQMERHFTQTLQEGERGPIKEALKPEWIGVTTQEKNSLAGKIAIQDPSEEETWGRRVAARLPVSFEIELELERARVEKQAGI